MSWWKSKKVDKVKSPQESPAGGQLSSADYEKIGRSIESVVIHGHYSTKRLFIFNTLRGVFFGLGSVLGATIVVLILVWLVNIFGDVPFIGDFFQSAENTIQRVNSTTP